MSAPKRKPKLTPAEQRKRFIETARRLEVDETEAGQERAFDKVGMGKPRAARKKRKAAR